MSARGARAILIEKMFEGNSDPLNHVQVWTSSGTSPEGVVTAPKGTFLVMAYVTGGAADATYGDCYINDDGGTSWVLINDEA